GEGEATDLLVRIAARGNDGDTVNERCWSKRQERHPANARVGRRTRRTLDEREAGGREAPSRTAIRREHVESVDRTQTRPAVREDGSLRSSRRAAVLHRL